MKDGTRKISFGKCFLAYRREVISMYGSLKGIKPVYQIYTVDPHLLLLFQVFVSRGW